MAVDTIDLQIIKLLQHNAKMSCKEIGQHIHLTGQAVGMRINRLQEEGIIENFTITVNREKLGITTTAIIKIIMNTADHSKIKTLLDRHPEVVEAFRISGGGCYCLKAETSGNDELNRLLDDINDFANYQLSLSIARIK